MQLLAFLQDETLLGSGWGETGTWNIWNLVFCWLLCIHMYIPKASRTYENVGPLKKARVSKQDPGSRKNTGFPNSGKSKKCCYFS